MAWAALCGSGEVSADVDLDDYVTVDAEVTAHKELSKKTIIESVRHSDTSFDNCDEQDSKVTAPPSVLKVDASDATCSFIGAHDDDVAMLLLT